MWLESEAGAVLSTELLNAVILRESRGGCGGREPLRFEDLPGRRGGSRSRMTSFYCAILVRHVELLIPEQRGAGVAMGRKEMASMYRALKAGLMSLQQECKG